MDHAYDQALKNMESTVHALAKRVPAPQRVPYKDSFVYRYVEKSLHQALVQKLARMVSTLHASRLLMEHGFVQEQATLQRVLDELQEDITFLAFGVIFKDVTELHQRYLEAFFEEEFDADTALDSAQKRPMIPWKKIQAYIARVEATSADTSPGAGAPPMDPHRGIALARTLSKAYSGYVHAASPHLMDMYGGNPPRFHMRGMRGTERHDEHREDLWNYFYRGIIAFALAAQAFGERQLFDQIHAFTRSFEREAGKAYAPSQHET